MILRRTKEGWWESNSNTSYQSLDFSARPGFTCGIWEPRFMDYIVEYTIKEPTDATD